eukprot:CAMPEP_0184657162 /NCGR_PEP_ID=MMETSP0308-20130426/17021_1 /TAXON_ID=38269 /ORGANISM="Gloeochaete witrockiana, Strain SAG 46.84" /LENGTH=174 /DNA_ID=CAMNT_0027094597 /DNA_START=143 /DNA_END=667 /DNA_ORIENTATION=-
MVGLHSGFMALAFQLFVTEAIAQFRLDQSDDRGAKRKTHMLLQGAGLFCVFLACIFQFVAEPDEEDKGVPDSLHEILGWVIISVLVIQALIGARKYMLKVQSDTDSWSWHPSAGKYLYGAAVLVAMIGAWELYQGYSWALSMFLTIVIAAPAAFLMFFYWPGEISKSQYAPLAT